MSHLPGNPYVERLVTDQHPRTSESLATLALAYEARTTNLIALFGLTKESVSEFLDANGLESSTWDSLAQQITTRLGLNEGAAG